jgi:two-component system response regulator DctR
MNPCVHIVDDEEPIRDSLAWLFRSVDLDCRTWESGEAFLDAFPIHEVGCVILDVRMSGIGGPAVFQELLRLGCDLPVVFLTGHAEVPIAVEALKHGAFDFVEKPFNDHRIVEIARSALDRHRHLRAMAANRSDIQSRLSSLTSRERQVMELLLQGQMNKQIAGTLDLAMRTIEVHRSSILQKFGVRSVTELAGIVSGLDRAP